jgi:hypothetical protein
MRTIKIFVEWDHAAVGYVHAIAVFYGGDGDGLLAQGILPQKSKQIAILSMKRLAEEKMRPSSPRKGMVILHEMGHAAHYYDLGFDNPFVTNAYGQAMTRGLYKSVPNGRGNVVRAYAATNEHEYFAELTCAYLDYCDFFPHDRAELRDYDSVGFELMRKVWGDEPLFSAPAKKIEPKPPETEAEAAARKEAAAAAKLTFAKQFLLEGDIVKARARLESIVKDYPGTKAAAEAAELLK